MSIKQFRDETQPGGEKQGTRRHLQGNRERHDLQGKGEIPTCKGKGERHSLREESASEIGFSRPSC
jgi:hypothetical protein